MRRNNPRPRDAVPARLEPARAPEPHVQEEEDVISRRRVP
jgi:hypothetical protein